MKLKPLIELPCMVTGIWCRFAVHVFEGRLTVDDMDRLEKLSDAWYLKNPGRTVELVVVFPSNARMTGEERTRMGHIVKRRERTRDASATVILGKGMVGAAQRSVLTGLTFIAPPPHPMKVFGACRDAVDWLAPYVGLLCGPEATPEALGDAVEDLCAGFRKRSV